MSQGGINKITGGILPPDVPLQITTDSGVVVPAANNVNIFGGTGITTSGAGSTVTIDVTGPSSITIAGDTGSATGNNFTFTGNATGLTFGVSGTSIDLGGILDVSNGGTGRNSLTNHGLLVGAATSPITQLAVGATNTVLLGNTGADPSFGTVPNAALTNSSVTLTNGTGITITGGSPLSLGGSATIALSTPVAIANGGTNATSFTTDGTVYYDGTKLNTTATGTSGWVLTSNGAGSAPTYQAVSASSISITGDTGGAQTGNAFTFGGGTTGLSFGGSADTFTTTFAGITANGGTVNLATDATTSTLNIGTGAGNKTITLGSSTTGSTTNINSGTGGTAIDTASTGFVTVSAGGEFVVTTSSVGIIELEAGASGNGILITSQGSQMQILSGTGIFDLSSDSAATTVNLATGPAVKTVTLGSTNTTSSTAIKSGSGNISMNSGLTVNSTGINTNSVQPAFLAYLSSSAISNVTGDGTAFTVPFNSTSYNRGSYFNTSTGTFTAPISGVYYVSGSVRFGSLTSSFDRASIDITVTGTSAQTVRGGPINPGTAFSTSGPQDLGINTSANIFMTANDVMSLSCEVSGSTKTVSIFGANGTSWFTWLSAVLIS